MIVAPGIEMSGPVMPAAGIGRQQDQGKVEGRELPDLALAERAKRDEEDEIDEDRSEDEVERTDRQLPHTRIVPQRDLAQRRHPRREDGARRIVPVLLDCRSPERE